MIARLQTSERSPQAQPDTAVTETALAPNQRAGAADRADASKRWQVAELALPGLRLVRPLTFGDERGWFSESYHQERYKSAGILPSFAQDNHSQSRHGVIRGMHFQNLPAPGQAKLVRVAKGRIFDVAVDIRLQSPTLGQWQGVWLDAVKKEQLFIPEGFAHGFCVESEDAEVLYKCSTVYNPASEEGFRWDDPDVGIRWPVDAPVVSLRDQAAPGFVEWRDKAVAAASLRLRGLSAPSRATRVWVLGSSGMLGQTITAKLTVAGIPWVGSGSEVDITRAEQIRPFAERERPSHLINCAAYTKVDECEGHRLEAMATNSEGPGNIAQVALRLGATAIHVSTDYVFDGKATAPYREDSPCEPLGLYGLSKRRGEEAFLANFDPAGAARGYVVRTSWLFGQKGRGDFVRTMLRKMQKESSVSVVADQVGRPTNCADLADALLRLGGVSAGTDDMLAAPGIYHFANDGETSWYGFARVILAEAKQRGVQVSCQEVRALTTSQYPTPAARPEYSALAIDKIASTLAYRPRAWREALRAHLDEWVQLADMEAPGR